MKKHAPALYVVRFGDPDPTDEKNYVQKIQRTGRDPYAMTARTTDIERAALLTHAVAVSVAQRCNGWVVSKPLPRPPAPGLFPLLLCLVLASCSAVAPVSITQRPDGSRVSVTRSTVFLKAYDPQGPIDIAKAQGITAVDSMSTRRRPRAFGSAYITTITGK